MAKNSVTKRIRFTKRGKLIKRKMAQSHFKAKKSSKQIQQKRKSSKIDPVDIGSIRRYMLRSET